MITVELDHATVAFTSRKGGLSAAPFDSLNLGLFSGDDSAVVESNIERTQSELGVEQIHVLKQVHGATIIDVDHPTDGAPAMGDGMISTETSQGLLVTGADCPPVAISSPQSIAVLHCGWRPLAAGIIENALDHLGEGPLQAAIGPGISQFNYEVGPEVVEALGADAAPAFSHGHLSLHAVIEAKLERGGVERIESIDDCTFADPENYFSYRRDGALTGRQAGIAWRS